MSKTTEKTRYLVELKIDEEGYSLDGIYFEVRKYKTYAKARKYLKAAEQEAKEADKDNYTYRILQEDKVITKTVNYRTIDVDYIS